MYYRLLIPNVMGFLAGLNRISRWPFEEKSLGLVWARDRGITVNSLDWASKMTTVNLGSTEKITKDTKEEYKDSELREAQKAMAQ